METALYLIFLFVGLVVGWYLTRQKLLTNHKIQTNDLNLKLQMLSEKCETLTSEAHKDETTINALREELQQRSEQKAIFETKANDLQIVIDGLKNDVGQRDKSITELTNQVTMLESTRSALETRMQEMESNIEEEKNLLKEAETKLRDVFNSTASEILKASTTEFLKLAHEKLSGLQTEAKGDIELKKQEIDSVVKPLSDALSRYESELKRIEEQRQKAYGSLDTTLKEVSLTQQRLQAETTNLVNALRRPQVKGRWGEITLQRVVELAGMSEYCDFEMQVTAETEEGRLRPDMIIRLPNNRIIVVDAKVSLAAYMDAATEGIDETTRIAHLQRHSQLVREHMRKLSGKSYWNQFTPSPDFVVMFLPGDPFLSAALEYDRTLIEDGFASHIVIATPTTLVALLRAIAYGWKQEQLAENAQRIAEEGKILFDRLLKFMEHLEEVRKGLEKATLSYNLAARSWESRILPSARRLKELGAAPSDAEMESPSSIEIAPQTLPQLETDKTTNTSET